MEIAQLKFIKTITFEHREYLQKKNIKGSLLLHIIFLFYNKRILKKNLIQTNFFLNIFPYFTKNFFLIPVSNYLYVCCAHVCNTGM